MTLDWEMVRWIAGGVFGWFALLITAQLLSYICGRAIMTGMIDGCVGNDHLKLYLKQLQQRMKHETTRKE